MKFKYVIADSKNISRHWSDNSNKINGIISAWSHLVGGFLFNERSQVHNTIVGPSGWELLTIRVQLKRKNLILQNKMKSKLFSPLLFYHKMPLLYK